MCFFPLLALFDSVLKVQSLKRGDPEVREEGASQQSP